MNMHISEQNIAESNIPNTEPTKPNEISLNGTDESENLPDLHDDANMSNLIRIYNQKLEVVNAHAHVEQAEIMSKLKIEQAEMISKLKIEQAEMISKLKIEQADIMSKLKIEQADIMSKLKIEQAEMISKLKMKQIKAICEREKFHWKDSQETEKSFIRKKMIMFIFKRLSIVNFHLWNRKKEKSTWNRFVLGYSQSIAFHETRQYDL